MDPKLGHDISRDPIFAPLLSLVTIIDRPCPAETHTQMAIATPEPPSADRVALQNYNDTSPALNVELPFTSILKSYPLLILGTIRSLHVTQEIISEELRSLDLGFNLVHDTGVQRSPSCAEVRLLREVYPEIREVIHFPPFLIVVCTTLFKATPMSIAGLLCHFTLDRTDIPLLK